VSARAVIGGIPLCEVASAATTNVEDGCCVFFTGTLAGELLVEAEHGALRAGVHVAGAAAAAGVDAGGGGSDRGWTAGGRESGCNALGGVDAAVVACASAATVDVVGGGDGWERLGDLERHCGLVGLGSLGVWLFGLVARYDYFVVVEPFLYRCCGLARIDGICEAVVGRVKAMS